MRRCLLLAVCLLSLSATRVCGQGPNHIFDKQADFSRYKTYKWAKFPNAMNLGELTQGQLTGTLQVELAKKGLTKVQSDHADLYVAYQIVSNDPKNTSTFDVSWPDGSRMQGIAGLGNASNPIHAGELVLDFYDSSTKALVFRSVVAKPIDLDGKPASRQKQLDRAAEKLLKHYQRPEPITILYIVRPASAGTFPARARNNV